MAKNKLNNKVAIITGSGRGIGKTTAIELAKNGVSVVINDINKEILEQTEIELKALNYKVLSICCDITKAHEAENLVAQTIAHFGRLDILINNAGLAMSGNIADLNPNVYQSVFDVNVIGVTNVLTPALPHIRKTKGSIIFISSLAGMRGIPGFSAYSASKMALRAIAESLKLEERKHKIHVGLMFLGFTQNDKTKQTINAEGKLVPIPQRKQFKVQSRESVAKAIVRNIKKRKFISILSFMGKMNALLQRCCPTLLEKIFIISAKTVENNK